MYVEWDASDGDSVTKGGLVKTGSGRGMYQSGVMSAIPMAGVSKGTTV